VLLLNVALLGCILSLVALLALCMNGAPALVPHIAFLLIIAIVLFGLINWCEPCLFVKLLMRWEVATSMPLLPATDGQMAMQSMRQWHAVHIMGWAFGLRRLPHTGDDAGS
jgi:hypothetical protein